MNINVQQVIFVAINFPECPVKIKSFTKNLFITKNGNNHENKISNYTLPLCRNYF